MSDKNPWADQWFKAQQQFVDAWTDMARTGSASGSTKQSDLWSQGFDMWRKACEGRTQPDMDLAMRKCMDMGKEYFSMAEQVSKSLAEGINPVQAVNQWLEQVKQSLQGFSGMPGFNGVGVADFMKQWFSPNASWQEMVAGLTPMNKALWQMPGMSTSTFNLGEAIDPLGRVLEAPGIGYFREPQEKQQKGIQLALEYQEANFKFNQAFLRVAIESIQGFQQHLMQFDEESAPKSMRELYDLWVEISEQHYAEFAMSEEYQSLYGDMVNRLMTMRRHYSEMADDFLRSMNLPNTREIDTMQERLQQLRRDNFALKKDIGEIRAALARLGAKPAASVPARRNTATKKPVARKSAAAKPVAKKSAAAKPAAAKPAAAKPAAGKKAVKKPAVKKAAAAKARVTRSTAGA